MHFTGLEQTVFFASGSLRLEGRLSVAAGPNAVVVTHPHPLYGGDLDNPVVATLVESYHEQGFTTLRFNFRGVGASQGHYADGLGECEDVKAAATYLTGLGKTVSDLAGYSFGAWVNLSLRPPLAMVRRQVAVAPPVALLDFSAVGNLSAQPLVIVGDCDAFAPLERLRELLPCWHSVARLLVVPGADHFYQGTLSRLQTIVAGVLAEAG